MCNLTNIYTYIHTYIQQYFGEIKNELLFYERVPKSHFSNHLADSARRRLKRKLFSIRSRKKKKKYDVPSKSYSVF